MFYKYYKKSGVYTNSEVRKLGRSLGAKKVGHSGILDPLAQGLILVATDADTRLLEFINFKNKKYVAKCKFGYFSDTLDTDAEQIHKLENPALITKENLLIALEKIRQLKEQLPPKYSAKKINGVRAYVYARENKGVELKMQKIEILDASLIEFDAQKQEATFAFDVSEGTYIRSLLRDIAALCNTEMVMSYLKRDAVGLVKLEKLEPEQYSEISYDLIFDLSKFALNEKQVLDLSFGREIKAFSTNMTNLEKVLLINKSTNLICAVGEFKNGRIYPKKVFPERLLWKK